MTKEMVVFAKQHIQAKERQQATKYLDHSRSEISSDDLRRNVEREKVDMKRRGQATKVFSHS